MARRRQLLSHAKVRSMTQLRATITKPFASSGRLTISIRGPVDFRERVSKLLARVTAVSKQVCNSRVARTRQSDDGRRAVPILNIGWCTMALSKFPCVSVTMWRLRPLILLPASKPRGPPLSVVLTD